MSEGNGDGLRTGGEERPSMALQSVISKAGSGADMRDGLQ